MDWFKAISRVYPKHWTKEMVADAVVVGKITEEQYREITDEPYVSE